MDDISLKDVICALSQGWRIIVGFIAAAFLAALLYNNFFVRPVYEAQVNVEITPFFEQFGIASTDDEGHLIQMLQGLYREQDIVALFEHPDTSAEVFHFLALEQEGLTIKQLQESISIVPIEDIEYSKLSFLVRVHSSSLSSAERILETYIDVFDQKFKEHQVARLGDLSTNIKLGISWEQNDVVSELRLLEKELSLISPAEKVIAGRWGVVLEPNYEVLASRQGELHKKYIRLEADMLKIGRIDELGELVMASEGIHELQKSTAGEVHRRDELIVVAAVILGLFVSLVIVCGRYFWREFYAHER